jgi:3',5'-cyclic AMP phosphodiesterase CpdA
LRKAITSVNRSRPRFFVVMGNFTKASCLLSDQNEFNTQTATFRKVISRVSETIPIIFVPGSHDVGSVPSPATIQCYRRFTQPVFKFKRN